VTHAGGTSLGARNLRAADSGYALFTIHGTHCVCQSSMAEASKALPARLGVTETRVKAVGACPFFGPGYPWNRSK
jgi:hypothetical protein